jgi:predicted GH43/DUF377 family glycosyl hydrolase
MLVIRRHHENPILTPRREHPWEALATFHPSVIKTDTGFMMYYRAVAKPDALQSQTAGTSTIGIAFSEDGSHFHSRRQVITPKEPWEMYGCEDPRATLFEGKWYVFYTALGGFPYGPDNIKVGVAVGEDPDNLSEHYLVTPFNAKAATLFPERINGEAVLLLTAHTDFTESHPRPTIGIARAKNIEDFFKKEYWDDWHTRLKEHALPDVRRADDDHIEVGATPIKTDKGWLLIYSYIQHYYDEKQRVFGIEAALLDTDDPKKLISRTYPLFVPEEIYEFYGLVPNIVFPASAVKNGHRLDLYYSAADTTCAKASLSFDDLLRSIDIRENSQPFMRAKENPILTPLEKSTFESTAVFNPAAIDIDDTVHILYRAMGADNTSTVGLALSKDGIHIDERLSSPVYVPRAPFEQKRGNPTGNSGCEDPRVVLIDGRLYITYTAYDGVAPPRGAISSISIEDYRARHFSAWSEPSLITPLEVDDKDVALLPEKVDGNFLLYHRVSGRICADIVPDLSFEKPVARCIEIMGPREGMWDAAKVGIAGPPIKVKDGWLFIYHGVSRRSRYRLGAALLDFAGTTMLARTADPIFEPVAAYELEGIVNSVVFACGTVVRGDTLYLYYGGGDKVVGVATASLEYVLKTLR